MSTNNTGAGGVRNLRAMFENKANDLSTSPPSRGRSPNGSVSSISSRPVSKVRASFVSVERPGEAGGPPQWGLGKASDITLDGTSENIMTNGEMPQLGAILKGSPFESGEAGKQPINGTDRITTNGAAVGKEAESVQSFLTHNTGDKAASMIEKMKQPNPGPPQMTKLQTTTTAHPVKPLPTRQTHSKDSSPTDSERSPVATTGNGSMVRPRGGVAKIQAVMSSAKDAGEARKSIAEESSKKSPAAPTSNGPVVRPRGGGAKIQAVMNSAKEAEESRRLTAEKETKKTSTIGNGPVVRPRGGGAKIQAVMDSAREARGSRAASQKAGEVGKPDISKEKSNATEETTGATPQSPKTTRAPTQPKSLSKPTKLPAAATASTAASAAKKDSGRDDAQPTERKSGARGPPRVANTSTASSLAKKTSRVSLNANERPKSRISTNKAADEGFLARMTRPTASSTQKAHEKAQPESPPQTRRVSAARRDLVKKPSRKSLNPSEPAVDENKENESQAAIPPMPEHPDISIGVLQTSEKTVSEHDEQAQQAEVQASST